jgi:hypothetical protein
VAVGSPASPTARSWRQWRPCRARPSRSSAASGFTWEHDAHLYLERLLGFSRFMGSAGNYQQRIGREMAGTAS